MARRLNRKIKRGTLGHKDDPLVKSFKTLYNVNEGLIFRAITLFGDSKYTHKFLKFLENKQKNEKTSGISFDNFVREFETGDTRLVIENKLNLD